MTLDAFVLGANEPTEHFVPLKPGDMLLLDEAGMVGTALFAQAVDLAAKHGAVVRAIGDDRQLGAIGCGGALRLIDQHEPAVRLETVHRFRHLDGTPNEDEAAASLHLRQPPLAGTDDPWTYYWDHRRIQAGDTELMEHQVFAGWQKDQNAGHHALMIAPSNALVGNLNDRAQAYRLQLGELHHGASTPLQNGAHAYVGDVVVSRRNDRRLPVNRGHDFVKNNDVWTVTGIRQDGSLDVQHRDHHGTTTLPAEYVRNHVELGYASTIHRAQGMTYDNAHALLAAGLDRAQAYVATSRGRYGNRVYVALEAGGGRPGRAGADRRQHRREPHGPRHRGCRTGTLPRPRTPGCHLPGPGRPSPGPAPAHPLRHPPGHRGSPPRTSAPRPGTPSPTTWGPPRTGGWTCTDSSRTPWTWARSNPRTTARP